MRLGMGGGRALFFFPAFEKSNCTICFSKNYFSCFLKLWRGTMDGRRMKETNFLKSGGASLPPLVLSKTRPDCPRILVIVTTIEEASAAGKVAHHVRAGGR